MKNKTDVVLSLQLLGKEIQGPFNMLATYSINHRDRLCDLWL